MNETLAGFVPGEDGRQGLVYSIRYGIELVEERTDTRMKGIGLVIVDGGEDEKVYEPRQNESSYLNASNPKQPLAVCAFTITIVLELGCLHQSLHTRV